MRLINTRTLSLREFPGANLPRYAILSHRWIEGEEVSYQEFQDPAFHHKRGYQKVRNFCRQALRNEHKWAWADTCCIDKSNSVELAEAINSMFKWYRKADLCYVYLSDYDHADIDEVFEGDLERALKHSPWFKRGWTLQELLAPADVSFFDQNWEWFGTKDSLADVISAITNIDADLLEGESDLDDFSCAQKMSWAAYRVTTRIEDRAYSLLGLFDITGFPLAYGEGDDAFFRLQSEIIRRETDQTIFAWTMRGLGKFYSERNLVPSYSMLAPSPDCFQNSSYIIPYRSVHKWTRFWLKYLDTRCITKSGTGKSKLCFNGQGPDDAYYEPFGINQLGLNITLPSCDITTPEEGGLYEVALFCYDVRWPKAGPITLCLGPDQDDPRSVVRAEPYYLGRVSSEPHREYHHHWEIAKSVVKTPRRYVWPVEESANVGDEDIKKEMREAAERIADWREQGRSAKEKDGRSDAKIRKWRMVSTVAAIGFGILAFGTSLELRQRGR